MMSVSLGHTVNALTVTRLVWCSVSTTGKVSVPGVAVQ